MNTRPTVQDIVDNITCELYLAMYQHNLNADPVQVTKFPVKYSNYGFDVQSKTDTYEADPDDLVDWSPLVEEKFQASIQLTIKVINNEAANPSLAFLTPYTIPEKSIFSLGLGGQFTGTQTRTLVFNYAIDMGRLIGSNADNKSQSNFWTLTYGEYPIAKCPTKNAKFALKGTLGLEETIQDGLLSLERTASLVDEKPQSDTFDLERQMQPPPPLPAKHPKTLALLPDLSSFADKALYNIARGSDGTTGSSGTQSFTSTDEFYVLLGGSVSPGWTLSHFTGPSGSSGLINASRTDDNTLQIIFKPVGQVTSSDFVPPCKELNRLIGSAELPGVNSCKQSAEETVQQQPRSFNFHSFSQAEIENTQAAGISELQVQSLTNAVNSLVG